MWSPLLLRMAAVVLVVGAAAASEYPERECCDPVVEPVPTFITPSPMGRGREPATTAVTTETVGRGAYDVYPVRLERHVRAAIYNASFIARTTRRVSSGRLNRVKRHGTGYDRVRFSQNTYHTDVGIVRSCI